MPHVRRGRGIEPDIDLPFDHGHSWRRVRLDLIPATEITRDGSVRAERTYSCPGCGYELSESVPIRTVSARS